MSYNLFKVWGFRPSPYLRAVMRLARPAMNVPAAIRILAINFASFRLFFFLLICISPPYDYIIICGVPYVNRKFDFYSVFCSYLGYVTLPFSFLQNSRISFIWASLFAISFLQSSMYCPNFLTWLFSLSIESCI